VSFAGRLEEVSVPELLHLLSWAEKTGTLTLRRGPAEGVVVFHRGRIVTAASNSPREVLGSILVCRKLVSEETLMTAVVFIPSHRGFVGCVQSGIEVGGEPADELVRKLVMPLDQASVLADVAAKRGTYRGLLPLSFWNDFLVKQLGGAFPREVVVVPAVVDGHVVALLYGDNVPSDAPIGPASGLEAAMTEACTRYVRPFLRARSRGAGVHAQPTARSGLVRTAP